MSALALPRLSAGSARLIRSGLRWLKEDGAALQAREPLASCYVRLHQPAGVRVPLEEEQNDLQVVLALREAGSVHFRTGLGHGGYRDMVEAGEWRPGEVIADGDRAAPRCPWHHPMARVRGLPPATAAVRAGTAVGL